MTSSPPLLLQRFCAGIEPEHQYMKRRQAGLTLIELMVALALTVLLGIMLAALVNGWLKVRERLQVTTQETSVLDFCLALERRFDSPVLRRVYDQRLLLESSADLYAAAAPHWVQRERLDRVGAMNILYYQGGRWLAWPSDQPAHPGRGVRLELQRDGAPYVCTFALPWGRS